MSEFMSPKNVAEKGLTPSKSLLDDIDIEGSSADDLSPRESSPPPGTMEPGELGESYEGPSYLTWLGKVRNMHSSWEFSVDSDGDVLQEGDSSPQTLSGSAGAFFAEVAPNKREVEDEDSDDSDTEEVSNNSSSLPGDSAQSSHAGIGASPLRWVGPGLDDSWAEDSATYDTYRAGKASSHSLEVTTVAKEKEEEEPVPDWLREMRESWNAVDLNEASYEQLSKPKDVEVVGSISVDVARKMLGKWKVFVKKQGRRRAEGQEKLRQAEEECKTAMQSLWGWVPPKIMQSCRLAAFLRIESARCLCTIEQVKEQEVVTRLVALQIDIGSWESNGGVESGVPFQCEYESSITARQIIGASHQLKALEERSRQLALLVSKYSRLCAVQRRSLPESLIKDHYPHSIVGAEALSEAEEVPTVLRESRMPAHLFYPVGVQSSLGRDGNGDHLSFTFGNWDLYTDDNNATEIFRGYVFSTRNSNGTQMQKWMKAILAHTDKALEERQSASAEAELAVLDTGSFNPAEVSARDILQLLEILEGNQVNVSCKEVVEAVESMSEIAIRFFFPNLQKVGGKDNGEKGHGKPAQQLREEKMIRYRFRLLMHRSVFASHFNQFCQLARTTCQLQADLLLRQQQERLRTKQPEELGILSSHIPAWWDSSNGGGNKRRLYGKACLYLEEMGWQPVPLDVLLCIYASSLSIYQEANYIHMANTKNATLDYHKIAGTVAPPLGADAFFPLLVYVVIQSNAPCLVQSLHYAKAYAAERELVTEFGYYLTSLEAAISHVIQYPSESESA
jgi:hypothetical protein